MSENDLKEATKQDVILALKDNDKVKAIMLIQNELICGLKNAKDLADDLEKKYS